MIDHVATLYRIVFALIALNVLTVVVAILAWRWRAPGEAGRGQLTAIERALLRLIGGD